MNKTLILSLAIVLAGVLVGGGILWNGINKDSEDVPLFRESFVEGCYEEGGTLKECNCMYDNVLDEYGMEGFIEMAGDYERTGLLPTKAQILAAKCIK